MIPIPFIEAQWEFTDILITGVFLYVVCRLKNVNILKQDVMIALSFIRKSKCSVSIVLNWKMCDTTN